jgi:ribose transport system ATP-binding protein
MNPAPMGADDGPPLLEMTGIGKRFGGVVALAGVDFTVRAGEVVGLIGENGAGKSTLMKILGGLHRPDAGTIRIAGRAAAIGSVAAATALGIAFVHQELSVFANLDIAGNVFLGREPRLGGCLLDRARMHRETAPILRRVGLDLDPATPLAGLSLAQRQLVEIAKALSLAARLIIMDEPTSSLTRDESERLRLIIADLATHGHAVVYISHRLHEMTACCARAVILRDGRRVGELAGAELTHRNLVRLMVGRDLPAVPTRRQAPADAGGLTIRNLRTAAWPARALDLDLRRGEVLGLAGLVGAGRSDLARALFGIDPRVAGEFALDGRPVVIRSPPDAIRAGLALVPEDRKQAGLVLAMRVRENVTLATLPHHVHNGLIRRADEDRATAAAVAELGIKVASGETTTGHLSGGNQQKVVIAKWLATRPQVIILDEPTRGVDVGAKHEIYALMHRFAAEGAAVLMISSDMEEVIGQSDRVAVMHEGSLAGILDGDRITEEAIMELAIGQVTA